MHFELAATKKELKTAKEKVIKAQDDLTDAISATVNSDEQAQLDVVKKERADLKK